MRERAREKLQIEKLDEKFVAQVDLTKQLVKQTLYAAGATTTVSPITSA